MVSSHCARVHTAQSTGFSLSKLIYLVALANSGRYSVRVLTRNAQSSRAQDLLKLPNVGLIQGKQDSQSDLHAAFKGVYGAWVNTDGFTLGEKAELFYGIRAYEIARAEGVQHYVYANIEYALKNAGWDEAYHAGHHDAKGRVGEFILAQGQDGDMKASLLSTGPYLNMFFDGMYVPEEKEDGSFVWANPASTSSDPVLTHYCVLLRAINLNLCKRGWENSSDSFRGRRSLQPLAIRQPPTGRWSKPNGRNRRNQLCRRRKDLH